MELADGETVAVSGGESSDEYGVEIDETPLQEKFSAKLLLWPSGKTPSQTSGTIVYVTTAVICKS